MMTGIFIMDIATTDLGGGLVIIIITGDTIITGILTTGIITILDFI